MQTLVVVTVILLVAPFVVLGVEWLGVRLLARWKSTRPRVPPPAAAAEEEEQEPAPSADPA